MNPIANKFLILAALTLGLASASGQTSIDFNGSDPSASFTTAATTWNATSGIGGTGALDSSGNSNTVYNTSFSTTGVTSFSISVMVKAGASFASGGTSGVLHLGFGTASNALNFTADSGELFGVRVEGDNTGTAGALRWSVRTDTVAGANAQSNAGLTITPTGSFSLTTGNWYQASATFTKQVTSGAWSFSSNIVDYGTAGTTAGATLSSVSGTFTQAATWSASSLYGAVNFRNSSVVQNLSTLDNLTINASAVPEPSTYAAIAGLAVLGLAALRRRRA